MERPVNESDKKLQYHEISWHPAYACAFGAKILAAIFTGPYCDTGFSEL
jgi:hypothetical protein